MRYQTSWTSYLTLSTACVLVYYGVILHYRRRHANRKTQEQIPWTVGITNAGTGIGSEKHSPRLIDSPISVISQYLPSSAATLQQYPTEESEIERFSQMMLLQIISQPLAALPRRGVQAPADTPRIITGYGSLCFGLPLPVPETGTALGLHEASP